MASKKFKYSMDGTDIWCGYVLSKGQKSVLNELALNEFERPINQRKKPYELVELTRKIIKKKQPINI